MSWSASNGPNFAANATELMLGISMETSQNFSVAPPPNRQSQGRPPPQHLVASTTTTTTSTHGNPRDRMTVPSACVQCRSKHLKCDGLTPCSRCSANAFDCLYVKSRRGFKGTRRLAAQAKPVTASLATAGNSQKCPFVRPGGSSSARSSSTGSDGVATPAQNRQHSLAPSCEHPHFDLIREMASFESKNLPAGMDVRERCIEAFFYHFFPAHPFILPRSQFMALRREKSLDHLEVAMRYVGSFYIEQAPTVELGLEAETVLSRPAGPKDAFVVQALLILAIGLDGYTYQDKALQVLFEAQEIALQLGMNKRDFAVNHGNQSSVLEESWRRTWWELYVVDGMIAGVHQKSSFRLNTIEADVTLPCEEKDYCSGHIPKPHSMEDFDEESFTETGYSYSSFTYRIAAIRNLGKVLSSPFRQMQIADEPAIDRIDAHLVNWKLHLPESKRTAITSEGQLDEMLFQAHMISEATTVLLHREYSELDSSVAKNVTSCAPHKPITPGQSYNIHAMKTVQASQNISKLIMMPVSLAKHTHFFTCVVTLASIVHLSCWSVLLPLNHDDDVKQQLRLNIGALKGLWQIWPSAEKAFGQVKGVAQEIYAAKKQAAAIGFGEWTGIAEEEVLQAMIEDQTILEELQLL